MAVVKSFFFASKETQRVHPTTVECHCSLVTAPDGRRYLQLDTHGSEEREIPGKISQTLQFDAERALQLKQILDRVFGT
jgi:hypothetical protein